MTKEKRKDFEEVTVTIDRITYARLVNTGNYENERLEVSAQVGAEQDPDKVLDYLKQYVGERTNSYTRYDELRNEHRRMENKHRDLTEKIQQAQETWERVRLFMLAQGIKSEDQLPTMTNLLPAASSKPEPEEAELLDEIPY